MKILLNNFLLFCICQGALAQVSGKLITANGRPVPFANILLLNSRDSSFAKAALANEEGAYQVENIPTGIYILRLSSTGYQTWDSPVFEITYPQNSKDFGSLVLKENTKELGEVIVRAEKPLFQQQPEGLVINVENSVLTRGSSVLEVLERSPGVVIDHRNNGIALNGKTGVMIMLNGKLMRMPAEQAVAFLNGMRADDIEKIELLTAPPVKYDAEGSAGLINIVLKKTKKQGTNGTASVTGGYGLGEKSTANVNLSHNTKNINLYGSYTFSHNRTYSDMFITSAQNMPFLGGQVVVTFLDTTRRIQNDHDATAGIDVKLNSKTTIGGSITYNKNTASVTILNDAGYNILPDSLLQFTGSNKGTNRWNNLVNSIYLEKTIRDGEKINIGLDYLYFDNNSDYVVRSSFINKHGEQAGTEEILFSPHQKGFANTTIQVGVAKMDYTKQLGKKVKLETGIKGTYTQSSSLSGIESLVNNVWTTSSQTSNDIIMKESIAAAYAGINSQITQSTNLVVGARYEYSYTNMDNPKLGENIINRRLGSLFPAIFFSRKFNDRAELQLSYTKRISRPSYNDLASYMGYSDPTAVYTGNPFLKPTISQNIKLGYNYRGYSFSVLFSRDDDAIARYQLTESPAADILYISPQNLARQHNITFQTNLPLKINSWWTMNYAFVGGPRQFKVDYTRQPFEKSYFGYSLNFNQSFKLPRNFSAELSGWYNSFSYNGTIKADGFGMLNAGIKKELKNNKGTFQLSVSDILRNAQINVYYGTLTKEAFFIENHVAINTESRKFPIIRLTYSRSFGAGLIKTGTKKGNVSKDEMDRVRKD